MSGAAQARRRVPIGSMAAIVLALGWIGLIIGLPLALVCSLLESCAY